MAAGDPINYADLGEIRDLTISKPLVRLVQAVAQSIPDNTATAITFTTEEIDTHGFHDTGANTSRITPTVAGYYWFFGCYFSAAMTTPVSRSTFMRKNGATATAPGPRDGGASITSSRECSALISCNGTTDYVELIALQDSSGAVNTVVSTQLTSVFECRFERSL